jgi:LCP family protein required for cell wall assembly
MTDDDEALRDRLLSNVDESAPSITADQVLARTPIARHAHVRKGGAPVRRKLRRRLLWTGIAFAAVVVVLIGGLLIDASVLNGEIKRIPVHGLAKEPSKGPDQGTENILLVGDTSRCVLKVQNPAYGLCSQGVTGVNSDVVMILHLNPNVPSASILSIPRDLFVPNARTTGANKIDAALAQGPSQLVAAIEQDFGIPIQHYVELNFDSFAGVVDALGGVRMYFPMPVFDAESGLDITTPGCHGLNGTEALEVVRARHLQYRPASVTSSDPTTWPLDPESDLSRIRRDHEFLRVLATAVSKRGLGNPVTDQDLVSSVVSDLQVDSGFSFSHMINLVLTSRA